MPIVLLFSAIGRSHLGNPGLMDLSNLFVAQENGGDSYREWRSTLESCAYFHIAGARRSPIDEGFWIDSHDCAIEPEILLFAERCWSARNPTHKTRFISVERDHNISARSWRRDIRHVRERLSGHRRENTVNSQALLDPRQAKSLSRATRDFAIADQSLRRLSHAMFDPVPELLAIAGHSSSQMFEAFAAHCVDSRLPMDWRLHIDLLRWLEESPWRQRIDESTNGPEIWLGS